MRSSVVLCTVPSAQKGQEIARALIEANLAACVNVIPGLTSFYRWEGKLQEDAEALMIIKTSAERLPDLYANLPKLHPYTVPEGIGLEISSGLEPYLSWLDQQCGTG